MRAFSKKLDMGRLKKVPNHIRYPVRKLIEPAPEPPIHSAPLASDRSYFSHAATQLSSRPTRRHSIVPRRNTQAAYEQHPSDLGSDAHSMSRSSPCRRISIHPLSGSKQYTTTHRLSQGAHEAAQRSDTSLRELVRRTSHDFGTISTYPWLQPIPFKPPFLPHL